MSDLNAGIIVGIIAIPLSIALAIASGVSPEKGLHTAIIAGFIISFLGGSRVQIGGPTGAFVIILFNIVQKYGINGLMMSTIMAGIILIIMGLFRFGSAIKFIPYPITTGFTSGIAVVIFSTQVKDFLGLRIENLPSEFIHKIGAYVANINTLNSWSLFIGALSLVIIIIWPKINQKIPGSLIAILVTTAISLIFKLDVETIGSKFGEISSALPKVKVTGINFGDIPNLIHPAITIAILAGIESLLSAVVADGMIGGRHRPNMELVAQGVANIASGLFGGIPATGAIGRTAANIKNGGRTPIAGMIHAFTVMVIMVIFMPYAKLIPLASLSAILIIVAYNMSEWRSFMTLLKAPKSDIAVLLSTFIITVIFDLVIAIEIGVVLAAILFMNRMADVTSISLITDELIDLPDKLQDTGLTYNSKDCKDMCVYEINGPFFFGAADRFVEVMNELESFPRMLMLKMGSVPAMDATGYHELFNLYKRCEKHRTELILSEVRKQPYAMLQKYGFVDFVGVDVQMVMDVEVSAERKLEEANVES